MPMPVLMGMYTPVAHQFLCLSLPPSHPLTLAAVIPSSTWHYPQRRLTQTMHPRSSTQSKSSMCISSKTTNPPCPAYLLFTSLPPGRRETPSVHWESRRRLDWIALSTAAVDLGPPSCSRSCTRTHALDPAPTVTSESGGNRAPRSRPAHPQGRGRHDDRRGQSPGWRPAPPGSGSAASLRRITVMRQAAAARSFSVPMVANAPGSAMAGLLGTGVWGIIRGDVVQWCVGLFYCMMVLARSLVWWGVDANACCVLTWS